MLNQEAVNSYFFSFIGKGYRSPGTLFSPVVYLTALAEGMYAHSSQPIFINRHYQKA
jgi:membrane peptidoglycan carboxypeptidase